MQAIAKKSKRQKVNSDISLRIQPELQELLPPLSESEYAGLEADILKNGVLSPIVVWEGVIVDGHHRYAICQKHGLAFEIKNMTFDSMDTAKLWAWQHQDHRRNLTPFQRTEVALKFKPMIAAKGKANMSAGGGDKKSGLQNSVNPIYETNTRNEIANIANVSHDTVARVEFLTQHADEPTKQKLRKGDTTINAEYKRLKKALNRQEREVQKQADVTIPLDDRVRLYVSGIADASQHVEAESVDFIVTDPPYPREYLHVYSELSQFAKHALKPGGSLLCMVGQSYLPEVIAMLADVLDYRWTLAYLTPGGQATQLWERKVNTFWKPILWFTKGESNGDWIGDVANSKVNDNDKRHHHWGQSESGMFHLMERFLLPNQTVCDPFLGGATTGVCAIELKCRFIGLDIDADCIAKSTTRLANILSRGDQHGC